MTPATKTLPKSKAVAPNATHRNGKGASSAKSPVQSRGDLTSGGFTYPAVLIEGSQEDTGQGWKLNMVFHRLDRQFDDGNPAPVYIHEWTTRKDNTPIKQGSPVDTLALSFWEQTGEALDVFNDDSIAGFIGHAFMLTDEDTGETYTSNKTGKEKKVYLTTCIEYLGEDYAYEGNVTTIGGGSRSAAGLADFFDPAAYLVALFDGKKMEALRAGEAMALVKDDPMVNEVKYVLDKPLRGFLVKPNAKMLDLLIEAGLATEVKGVFTAN
jgi:hypothetical protein